jgi:hypothetical protein
LLLPLFEIRCIKKIVDCAHPVLYFVNNLFEYYDFFF